VKLKVYEPTTWEKFSLWAELEEVQLTAELITYYLLCCLFGLVTGYGIGMRLMAALERAGII